MTSSYNQKLVEMFHGTSLLLSTEMKTPIISNLEIAIPKYAVTGTDCKEAISGV
jgi:hypothetical protein